MSSTRRGLILWLVTICATFTYTDGFHMQTQLSTNNKIRSTTFTRRQNIVFSSSVSASNNGNDINESTVSNDFIDERTLKRASPASFTVSSFPSQQSRFQSSARTTPVSPSSYNNQSRDRTSSPIRTLSDYEDTFVAAKDAYKDFYLKQKYINEENNEIKTNPEEKIIELDVAPSSSGDSYQTTVPVNKSIKTNNNYINNSWNANANANDYGNNNKVNNNINNSWNANVKRNTKNEWNTKVNGNMNNSWGAKVNGNNSSTNWNTSINNNRSTDWNGNVNVNNKSTINGNNNGNSMSNDWNSNVNVNNISTINGNVNNKSNFYDNRSNIWNDNMNGRSKRKINDTMNNNWNSRDDKASSNIKYMNDYDYNGKNSFYAKDEGQQSNSDILGSEEIVSSAFSNFLSSYSGNTTKTLLSTRVSLREARSRNQRRVKWSNDEVEKSKQVVERIQRRAEERIRKVEQALAKKLEIIQIDLDNEIKGMVKLLQEQLDFEKNRESQLQKFSWTLQTARNTKQEDIKANDRTIKEMIQLRDHVVDQSIISKLDVVIAQKQAVDAIDTCQMDDLKDMIVETQLVLEQTKESICLIEEALTPSDDIDYSLLIKLENVWKVASDCIVETESRMETIRDRYDMDRLSKLIILGEPIPPSLQIKANKSEENKVDVETETLDTIEISLETIDTEKNVNTTMTDNGLDTKDEKELFSLLLESVGNAAFQSAKAGVFGIKALLETLSEEDVYNVTSKALEKSSGIGKVPAGLKESIKRMNNMESENDLKHVIDDDLKTGLKSTGETLISFGQAGSLIAQKVGTTSSGSRATTAVKQSSDDLIKAFNAVTALSKKTLKKKKQDLHK